MSQANSTPLVLLSSAFLSSNGFHFEQRYLARVSHKAREQSILSKRPRLERGNTRRTQEEVPFFLNPYAIVIDGNRERLE
jgi:hypothetical protein